MPSVRFIDPSFTRQNPSTNGLVDVAAELVERGWEIEICSHALEPSLTGLVTHHRMRSIRLPIGLSAWAYFILYHWQRLKEIVLHAKRPDVIVSTGFLYLPADIATVHFSHVNWWLAMKRNGFRTWEAWRGLLISISGFFTEILLLWNPWKTVLLPVSESVADDMLKYAAPWKEVSLLPNQVLSDRFSPSSREQDRGEARRTHGFGDDETVLLFASAGHHFRKGFRQAVATVALLRQRGLPIKYLVVGGWETTLNRIRRQIRRSHPDFEEWIVFTGSVSNPEFHFAAADALFFPSLSEAFSLVEIEAAALGLPLYLTAHHGSEMILRDGVNGRQLPWDVAGMADILEQEIRNRGIKFTSGGTGKALSKEAYFQGWLQQLSPAPAPSATGGERRKRKLMLIGHTYGLEVNRQKALHLADYFDVRVCTCNLEGWKILGQAVVDAHPLSHEEKFSLKRLTRWPHWQDYTKLIFRGLKTQIADFRPDIILVENEPWSWLRWQTRWAAWTSARLAVFAEFTWENVERPGIKGKFLKLVYHAAAATGDLLICGNEGARNLCIAAGYPEASCTVAPQLGINMEEHPQASLVEKRAWREKLGWPDDATVIGFCGRLVAEKGLPELVEAVKALLTTHQNLKLAIVGQGVLEKTLGIVDPSGSWLKILPAVRHEEVPAFLNKLDMFILPSKPMRSVDGQVWEEQFGHVLIEAMACGVLTLGSDSGAIPEVLNDPAVTFRHGNVDELKSIIEHWLNDEKAHETKAAEQRLHCAEHWTHAAVAARYAAFFDSCGLAIRRHPKLTSTQRTPT